MYLRSIIKWNVFSVSATQ